jgi:uroporphyrinogen decarboxylase
MTKRERIIKSVEHKQTDFTPYNIDFTKQECEKVAAYLNDPDFVGKIGNHISGVYYDGYLSEKVQGSGFWEDDFGVVWNRNGADRDIGVIEGLVIRESDPSGYVFPKLDEARLRKEYVKLAAQHDDTFKFGSIGFSMFERAWTLRGMENLLVDMALDPACVDQLLDAITDYNLKIIDIALEYDIDGFHFGDDWGQQKGLITGPEYWRRFIKPRMARMYAKAKNKGKIVSQHSCGDISEILPDLVDIGLDIYQTFQPEIYDMQKIKNEYGSYLTFWGGISTQRLLPFASPEEIKETVRKTIGIMGVNGGYIAAPTHSVPGDVPPENIAALIDVLQNQ